MVYIDQALCVGCGTCMRLCPMGYLCPERKAGDPSPPPMRPQRVCAPLAPVPERPSGFRRSAWTARPIRRGSGEPLEDLIRHPPLLIRHFSDRLPEKEVVQQALDTAAYAPSGKNQRAFRYTGGLGQKFRWRSCGTSA